MVAVLLQMKPTDTRSTDKIVGGYVFNDFKKGARQYPYSTDMTRNPLLYSSLSKLRLEIHMTGTVWCTML